MEIRRCDRAHYPEFLDMANDAFDFGAANQWFQKNCGNCTPYPAIALDEEIERHFICLIDGKIVGGLGAYPMDWAVADARGAQAVVKAYGIGQVSCLPDYRNRGVMSALMQAAQREMREQGFTVGYLTGDRYRYGHFGYDFGGNAAVYTLNKDRYGCCPAAESGLTLRTATQADRAELDAAYNRLPSRVLRNESAWNRQLRRENYHWYIGSMEGRKGYMAYVEPGSIAEVFGEPDTVAAMLKNLLAADEAEDLDVCYPMQNGLPDDMGRMLYRAASDMRTAALGLIAVINADELLKSLSPFLDGACPVSEEEKKALAQRLLGYAHRPLDPVLAGREAVTPLIAWISNGDGI